MSSSHRKELRYTPQASRWSRCEISTVPPESFRLGRQPAALLVGEPQALALELLLENTGFLDQIRDHVLLVAIQPAREIREQDLQRLQLGSHAGIPGSAVPWRTTIWDAAEFSDRTRVRMLGLVTRASVIRTQRPEVILSVGLAHSRIRGARRLGH